MVQVDTDAAHARGAVVADQLLALQAPLVDCYSSCGLDAGSARDSMARIIAALGLPDTARKAHVPRAGDDEGEGFDDEHKPAVLRVVGGHRSEEHTSELQSLMRSSYAVFCLKKKTPRQKEHYRSTEQAI